MLASFFSSVGNFSALKETPIGPAEVRFLSQDLSPVKVVGLLYSCLQRCLDGRDMLDRLARVTPRVSEQKDMA